MKTMAVLFTSLIIIITAPVSLFELDASNNEKVSETTTAFNSIIPHFTDIAMPKRLPPIGKWMYRKNGEKANWLGIKWEGKNLIEPINIILLDSISKSGDEAETRLYGNLKKAGFTDRNHHSSGYIGYIGDKFYPQIPHEKYHAISDGSAIKPNNHGRIFGPYYYKGIYVFIAAFSREVLVPAAKIGHGFQSFKRARDEFARKLTMSDGYTLAGLINLDNAIKGSSNETTGDHDGAAIVLSVAK
jgi:hypothetical protein